MVPLLKAFRPGAGATVEEEAEVRRHQPRLRRRGPGRGASQEFPALEENHV